MPNAYPVLYRLGMNWWEDNDDTGPLADVVAHRPAGVALDAGCGTGRHAIWLAQQGWTVVGVDGVEKALREAAPEPRRPASPSARRSSRTTSRDWSASPPARRTTSSSTSAASTGCVRTSEQVLRRLGQPPHPRGRGRGHPRGRPAHRGRPQGHRRGDARRQLRTRLVDLDDDRPPPRAADRCATPTSAGSP